MKRIELCLVNEIEGLPLATFLASLPDSALHYVAHEQRHPGAIYSLSTQRVWQAIKLCLAEHAAMLPKERAAIDPRTLLDALRELIAAIQAHLDDCFVIMKTCFPMPSNPPSDIFADKWLKSARHPTVGIFKSNIASYKKQVDTMNNIIKHNHGQLRSVLMDSDVGRIIGYFIESASGNGLVGPHRELHPHNTALSINRDLRFHVARMFMVGDAMRDALKRTIQGDLRGGAAPRFPAPSSLDNLRSVLNGLNDLPMTYFPDESHKPSIAINFEPATDKLSIIFGSLVRPRTPKSWTATTALHVDGYSNNYAFPYYGTSNEAYWFRGAKGTHGRQRPQE